MVGLFPVGTFVNKLWNLAKGSYGPTWYGQYDDHDNRAWITNDAGNNYGSWYGRSAGGWHFDCCGLLNTIIWGWDGFKPTVACGGATIGFTPGGLEWSANNNDAGWRNTGTWSSDFSGELIPGEILWCEGHVGAYIGYGISVEACNYTEGPNGVLFRFNVGNGETANWLAHCKADFIIDYTKTDGLPSKKDIIDAVNARISENWYSPNSTGANIGEGYYSTTADVTVTSDLKLLEQHSNYKPYSWHVETVEESRELTRDYVKDADQISNTRGTSLLSAPSLIETPFVKIKIGDFTFGSYSKYGDSSAYTVTFPNYIQSAEITKINGQVNTYVFQLVYGIEAGQDPNLLEKIFSSVGYGNILISYGDYSSPNFIYKEEQAIITNLTSNVDFARGQITYTLSCTSSVNLLAATSFNFPAYPAAKPSDIIKELLYSSAYGLKDVFPGMYAGTDNPWNKAMMNNWIATDDKAVSIKAKTGIDPLTYINYLVTCMISTTNTGDSVLQDSNYYMAVHDDGLAEFGGAYFTINRVASTSTTLRSIDTYEIDIGYPNIETNGTVVFDFKLDNSNTWALLYNYADKIQEHSYIYKIDNNGNMYTEEAPASAVSTNNFMVTPTQKTWWTQMTQFPIKATLTLKGLTRASMLMTYVRVNALFYGQRHISSGLYVVTAQKDSVSASGFRTTLSLLKIAGDTDYISRETRLVTRTTEAYVLTENEVKRTEQYIAQALNGFTLDSDKYTDSYTDEQGNVYYVFDSKKAYFNAQKEATHYYGANYTGISSGNALTKDQVTAKFKNLTNVPTVEELRQIAKNTYNMDDWSWWICAGWISGDGQHTDSYWSYLAACCPVAFFVKNGKDALFNYYTNPAWGGEYYSLVQYQERTKELSRDNFLRMALYLALTNLDTRPLEASGMCKENGVNAIRSIYDNDCIYYFNNYQSEDLSGGVGYGGVWSS